MSEIRPQYHCPVCHRIFYAEQDLINHFRIHEPELEARNSTPEVHHCRAENCTAMFPTAPRRNAHERIVHKTRGDTVTQQRVHGLYICREQHCQKVFGRRGVRINHELEEHGLQYEMENSKAEDGTYMCRVRPCTKTYKAMKSRARHESRVHGPMNVPPNVVNEEEHIVEKGNNNPQEEDPLLYMESPYTQSAQSQISSDQESEGTKGSHNVQFVMPSAQDNISDEIESVNNGVLNQHSQSQEWLQNRDQFSVQSGASSAHQILSHTPPPEELIPTERVDVISPNISQRTQALSSTPRDISFSEEDLYSPLEEFTDIDPFPQQNVVEEEEDVGSELPIYIPEETPQSNNVSFEKESSSTYDFPSHVSTPPQIIPGEDAEDIVEEIQKLRENPISPLQEIATDENVSPNENDPLISAHNISDLLSPETGSHFQEKLQGNFDGQVEEEQLILSPPQSIYDWEEIGHIPSSVVPGHVSPPLPSSPIIGQDVEDQSLQRNEERRGTKREFDDSDRHWQDRQWKRRRTS